MSPKFGFFINPFGGYFFEGEGGTKRLEEILL